MTAAILATTGAIPATFHGGLVDRDPPSARVLVGVVSAAAAVLAGVHPFEAGADLRGGEIPALVSMGLWVWCSRACIDRLELFGDLTEAALAITGAAGPWPMAVRLLGVTVASIHLDLTPCYVALLGWPWGVWPMPGHFRAASSWWAAPPSPGGPDGPRPRPRRRGIGDKGGRRERGPGATSLAPVVRVVHGSDGNDPGEMEMTVQSEDVSRSLGELTIPLYQARGWMKLLAVLLILGGVFTALTIWGILIAWLPIWGGVVLFQAAGALEEGQLAEGRTQAYERAFAKLKTFFILMGVFNLVGLGLMVLGLLFGLGMMAFMGEGMGPGMMGPRF